MSATPWMPFTLCVLTCMAGLLLTLAGEARKNIPWTLSGKLVAATAYIAAALTLGAGYSVYGRLILGGLFFSWIGDLFLVSLRNRRLFICGLLAFLVAHVAYSFAFVERGLSREVLYFSVPLMALFAMVVLRWLGPHVQGFMKHAVTAYTVVICLMLALAFSSFGLRASWTLLAGATLFVIADLAVARNQFVAPGLINRSIGLPLYFSAQLLLAASVTG